MQRLAFSTYVWSLSKRYGWMITIVLLTEWFGFKTLYPYPNFRGDSLAYIASAMFHMNATEWPVGYSKFLAVVHFFSHSDTVLVTLQYLLLEAAALFFLLTLKYFLEPGRIVSSILFALILVNPLFLHLSNYIMSDGLFVTLSLFWFAQLIWIIMRPSPIQLVSQALLLASLFTVRYNALFYPFVAALAFIISTQTVRHKLIGILFGWVLIGVFVYFTERQFQNLAGVRQFSPFSGWQLANNALYMYMNLPLSDADTVPVRMRALDRLVRRSFLLDRKMGAVFDPYIKDYYIWINTSPLWEYSNSQQKDDTIAGSYVKWSSMGPLFADYGKYLIKKHPFAYARYFVIPNIYNFLSPSIADLGYYNQGQHRIDWLAVQWFEYKDARLRYPSDDFSIRVLRPFPLIMNLCNIAYVMSLLLYLVSGVYKEQSLKFNGCVWLSASFWLLNLIFSTAASSVELRYQVFQWILCFSFFGILIHRFLCNRVAA